MALDQVWSGENYIEIVTSQSQLDLLMDRGFSVEIVHPDITAYLQSRLADKPMGAYKTLAEIYARRDSIISDFPSIVSSKISIGQTIEGRDVWAFKISDNPELDEDEPEVLFTACIHAREVITPEVLFYFIDHLTLNYGILSEVTDLVDNREMWFVLVVNPDGYYHNEVIEPSGGGMWRKNRRDNGDGTYGVDLNRNFGHMWGYDNEGSSPYPEEPTYRGTGPFSEPESENIRQFINSRNFILTVFYHSYSNLILWPYAYDAVYAEDNDIFSEIGDSCTIHNGYEPTPGWGFYPVNGGTDDWIYGERAEKDKIFAFSPEVGSYEDNFWPPQSRIADLISENLEPNMIFARVAGDIYSLRAPAAPEVHLPDTVDYRGFKITWSHEDSLNPAQVFELVEMTGFSISRDSAETFDGWSNSGFEISTDRYQSAPSSFYSGEDNGVYYTMQTVEPFAVAVNDSILFDIYYDIESDWDYGYVEVSIDGQSFASIPGSITTEDDPNGNNLGHGITGNSGGWVEAGFDLSAYAGESIFIRLAYKTDSYVLEEGMYVDNFYPHVAFETADTVFPVSDTSLFVSDKTPDTDLYYKVRARDYQRQFGQYSNTVRTYAAQFSVCGDANDDGAVNIGDVVYVINYVFKGGPAPDPFEMGDANGDGEVNIADGVYLINYTFKGGPEPIC
jgi:hypothetical protein